MTVGMDWLQHSGPMWVYWTEEILQFMHVGEQLILTGVQSQLHPVKLVSVCVHWKPVMPLLIWCLSASCHLELLFITITPCFYVI